MCSDVRDRTVNDMPKSHVYVWGAPCQPFSTCGDGEGERGRRGRGLLAIASLRYIKEHTPRLTIMENVRGLTSRHRARWPSPATPTTWRPQC